MNKTAVEEAAGKIVMKKARRNSWEKEKPRTTMKIWIATPVTQTKKIKK